MIGRPLHANHHCRHYSYELGLKGGPRCAAGIDLDNWPTAPCMPDAPASVAASARCAWREEYTADERAAWEKWRTERAARMVQVIALIPGSSRDRKTKPFWGQSGQFECPACKVGTVRWGRAPNNGHVRAACSTPDCAEFME